MCRELKALHRDEASSNLRRASGVAWKKRAEVALQCNLELSSGMF